MQSQWILNGSRSEKWVRVAAPAKINFFLKVLRRRASGYHEIRSLMVPIHLADTLHLSLSGKKTDGETVITCNDPTLPTNQGNLAFRAIQVLQNAGIQVRRVSIHIRKRIPAGAGLGGGSSDAAAVLKGMDYLLDLNLSREFLRELGLKIGADVPFFFMEQACEVSGIGEILDPIHLSGEIWLVIVFPEIRISTQKVYQSLDLELTNPKAPVNMPLDPGVGNPQGRETWQLVNHLERPVFVWYPFLREVCEELRAFGALEARMTGSGSSIFGVFRERAAADRALSEIRKRKPGWKFFLSRPVWQGIDESWRDTNGSDRGEGFSR